MAGDKQGVVHAAIDVGTTSIKAVLFDRAGREHVVARASVGVDRPQPVWRAMVGLLSELAQTAGPSLAGLAITAQGDGCARHLPRSNRARQPIAPAPLDGRRHRNTKTARRLAAALPRQNRRHNTFTKIN